MSSNRMSNHICSLRNEGTNDSGPDPIDPLKPLFVWKVMESNINSIHGGKRSTFLVQYKY